MDRVEAAEKARRIAEVADQARETLRDLDIYRDADEPLIGQYADAIATAEYLTSELDLFAPESQEYRRISTARDRARRNAASLATKLRLTARGRPKPKPPDPGRELHGFFDEDACPMGFSFEDWMAGVEVTAERADAGLREMFAAIVAEGDEGFYRKNAEERGVSLERAFVDANGLSDERWERAFGRRPA